MNSVAIWSIAGAAAAQDALTTKLKAVTTALAQLCYGACTHRKGPLYASPMRADRDDVPTPWFLKSAGT